MTMTENRLETENLHPYILLAFLIGRVWCLKSFIIDKKPRAVIKTDKFEHVHLVLP